MYTNYIITNCLISRKGEHMFIGRSRELAKLESLYNSDHFEFAVFHGRRRIGKTTLINEFIKDKHAVYYMAVEGTDEKRKSGGSARITVSRPRGISPSI